MENHMVNTCEIELSVLKLNADTDLAVESN